MTFIYDLKKNLLNQNKHGLDFEAVENFDWANAVTGYDERKDYKELRQWALGIINDTLCHLTFTLREGQIRVISLRITSRKER